MIYKEPQAIDAEQSVLGGIVLDKMRSENVIASFESLIEEDFFDEVNRKLFTVIKEMVNDNHPIDITTVASRFQDYVQYLTEIVANTPGVGNIKFYTTIVKEKAVERRYAQALLLAYNAMCGDKLKHTEKLDRMNTLIAEVDKVGAKSKVERLSDVLPSVLTDVEKLLNNESVSGTETGFADLDKEIGGLDDGELVVIGARPSVGKSTIGMNISEHVAIKKGAVLYISMEMTNKELAGRTVCSQGRVDNRILKNPGLVQQSEWSKLSAGMSKCNGLDLYLLDISQPTVEEIKQEARSFKRKHKAAMIVIDHLHLMKHKGSNAVEGIGNTTSALKGLAQELNIPVVLLAQLNRGSANENRPPVLTDLRGSGSIEQDSNKVFLLHSDEEQFPGKLQLYVAKNRNGVRHVGVMFASNLQYFRFDNLSHYSETY